ncbi:MAG: hypothetical protein K2H46_03040, partial [Muribaculaceae bacterium]|nr:hypothetical protein [Muribaculaceae bacterium]
GTEDGYQIMRTSNSNEIRFSFTSSESKYPTVIVKTTGTNRSIHDKLKELDFEKSGNGYEKKRNQNSHYKTYCSFGPHDILIFRRISNQK